MKRDVREAKRHIKRIVTDPTFYQQLREGIVEATAHPRNSITAVEEIKDKVTYRVLRERGLDTLVHVAELWIGLIHEDEHLEIARIQMAATVKFVQTKDEVLLDEQVFQYPDPIQRSIHSWTADEGEALRTSAETGKVQIIKEIASALLDLPSETGRNVLFTE